MPERPGKGSHQGLAHVHEVLSAAHDELLANPGGVVEGLDGALCGPHIKHLSTLAAVAAADGLSASQWRADVLAHAGPSAASALQLAETCMVQSGLWPWNAADASDMPDQHR